MKYENERYIPPIDGCGVSKALKRQGDKYNYFQMSGILNGAKLT